MAAFGNSALAAGCCLELAAVSGAEPWERDTVGSLRPAKLNSTGRYDGLNWWRRLKPCGTLGEQQQTTN